MKFQIKNSRNFFLQLSLSGVVSEGALSLMRAERDRPQRWPVDHPLHAQLHRLIPLLEALPLFALKSVCVLPEEEQAAPEFLLSHRCPPQDGRGETSVGTLNVRAWVRVASAQGASSRHLFEVPTLSWDAMGWNAAQALARHSAALTMLLDAWGFNSANVRHLKAADRLLKSSSDHTLHEELNDTIFASTDTFAIYSVEEKGYFNPKARTRYGPLGGASTFESAEKALQTVTARGLKKMAIVRLSTRVVGIDPILNTPKDLGELGVALVNKEAQQLRDTLAREQEKEGLAQLEKLRKQHPELVESSPSRAPVTLTPRRRM